MPMRDIFTQKKDFAHAWIGQPQLNALGLHAARVLGASTLSALRRARLAEPDPQLVRTFRETGLVVIPDFLPPARFDVLQAEARRTRREAEERAPLPQGGSAGFGPKLPFAGGFDRFDGSSLNRFVTLDTQSTPEALTFANDPRLRALFAWTSTRRYAPSSWSYYLLRHGDERAHQDIQKVLHRDTFHSAIKAWYFLEPVRRQDGPFEYVPGSHRLDARRLAWEYRRSVLRKRYDEETNKGSFRVGEEELAGLGLPPIQAVEAAENTLVLADVRGFHRRGQGTKGSQRLSLYASARPSPFKFGLHG